MRRAIAEGRYSPAAVRRWLEQVPTSEQDRVVDELFELEPFIEDAPTLPPGAVPYIPAPVSALVRLTRLLHEVAPLRESTGLQATTASSIAAPLRDNAELPEAAQQPPLSNVTFVDVGCGVGRAAMLLHLLTGASARGVEIQPHLVACGNATAQRLGLRRVTLQHGDACDEECLPEGDVYFMYCPFDAARVKRVTSLLERRARDRQLVVACLQVNVPDQAWLRPLPTEAADLRVYCSVSA